MDLDGRGGTKWLTLRAHIKCLLRTPSRLDVGAYVVHSLNSIDVVVCGLAPRNSIGSGDYDDDDDAALLTTIFKRFFNQGNS